MSRMFSLPLAGILTIAVVSGCGPTSSVGGEAPAVPDVKPVAPPAEMVGKWRLEVSDGKSTKTSVFQFMKDGHIVVDVQLDSPNQKVTDQVKRAITKVEKDQITWVDLSRTSAEGIESVLPAERRRTTTYRVQIKGDELHLQEVNEKGEPLPDSKPSVLKRVKE